MSTSNPLEGLPGGGVFPLEFSSAFSSALGGKAGKGGDSGEVIALKSSIHPENEGTLKMNKGKPSKLSFDTKKGSQVFDIREEPPASRECVIIWNPETASFSVHPLPTTLNLTLNRNLSGQPASAPAPTSAAAAKETAKPKRKSETSAKESPKKKSRPSLPGQNQREKTGGKSLPRKTLPKPVTTTGGDGKYKSSEIIEESDVEEGEEEEDDFAALLGAEMARTDDDEDVPAPAPAPAVAVAAAPAPASARPGNVRVAPEYYDDSTESEESDEEEF